MHCFLYFRAVRAVTTFWQKTFFYFFSKKTYEYNHFQSKLKHPFLNSAFYFLKLIGKFLTQNINIFFLAKSAYLLTSSYSALFFTPLRNTNENAF